MTEHPAHDAQRYIEELARSASEFFAGGMECFHRYRAAESAGRETAVSLIARGVELVLKTYLAHKNFGLISRDIPADRRVLLTIPESLPALFGWRKHSFGLGANPARTITLADGVSCFYLFFPHMKQVLLPHLAHLVRWDEPASHGIIPRFAGYEFDRFGYAALQVAGNLGEDSGFPLDLYQPTGADRDFLDEFARRRADRVEAVLVRARSRAQDGTSPVEGDVSPARWDRHTVACPVCGTASLATGYTEPSVAGDEDGAFTTLDFYAVGLECRHCGLALIDVEELKLAGMNTLHDRTDELERWFAGNGYSAEWDMG